MTRRVLFLSHSASRNGASILLLHLLQWLRAHTDLGLEVFCEGRGPLVEEFRAVARTHVWPSALLLARDGRPSRLDGLRRGLVAPALRALLATRRPDLVYANTAAAWNHVVAMARPSAPVLWHIHELPYALGLTLASAPARAALARATRVVAVSAAVADAMVQGLGVARERVDVVPGFVPFDPAAGQQRAQRRQRLLAELGWPAHAFVVGGCGMPGWRKGSDLFLQMAQRAMRAAGPRPLRFLWVGGGDAQSPEGLQFAHDQHAYGLDAVCQRLPTTAQVDAAYAAMDVFALSSREDPFPLVMLEAGVHGLPTLCFAGAGGGAEYAARDAGIVVPYGDVAALARAALALAADTPRLRALGQGAQRKVAQQHGIDTQAPRLLRSIDGCFAPPAAAPAPLAHPA